MHHSPKTFGPALFYFCMGVMGGRREKVHVCPLNNGQLPVLNVCKRAEVCTAFSFGGIPKRLSKIRLLPEFSLP